MIAVEGQVFHDPEADAALIDTLRASLDPAKVVVHELDTDVNDPSFALAMAEQAPRADEGGTMTEAGGTRAAARPGRRGRADHRRGRRHRPLGQVRRGGRHRPDHHLQLRPLPDGGSRVARGAAALRRRQRDRRRHGARGAAGRQAHPRARGRLRHRSVPADGRLPRRAAAHRLQRRAELPDRRALRRHDPHRTSRRRGWATGSRWT